jgi:natural product precursor
MKKLNLINLSKEVQLKNEDLIRLKGGGDCYCQCACSYASSASAHNSADVKHDTIQAS